MKTLTVVLVNHIGEHVNAIETRKGAAWCPEEFGNDSISIPGNVDWVKPPSKEQSRESIVRAKAFARDSFGVREY